MAEEPRWYVIHTYSGYENKVASSIEKAVENHAMRLAETENPTKEDLMTLTPADIGMPPEGEENFFSDMGDLSLIGFQYHSTYSLRAPQECDNIQRKRQNTQKTYFK